MKLPLLKTTLAALAGLFVTQAAHATTYTASPEDLILSFSNGSGSKDVQVDLGNITMFTNDTFVPVNVEADLANNYGANWYTLGTLQFSVAGVNSSGAVLNGYNNQSIFVTNSSTALYTFPKTSSLGAPSGLISNLYGGVGDTPTPGLDPNTDIYSDLAAGSISANGGQNYGGSFGNAAANFGTALPPSLYLDILAAGTNSLKPLASNSTVSTLGVPDVFTINAAGLVTFGPAVVPEPSTYALMALGIAGLVFIVRRKSIVNL